MIDPRPSPTDSTSRTTGGALRVVGADGEGDRALAEPESEQVTYGLAEFIAAEEMSRTRGFWWSPDADRLLVARADDTPVRRWWIADPAHPEREPQQVAYPAAGTANADVRLYVIGLDGSRTEVAWDRARYPYLARVHWSAAGAPLLLVQARDQRSQLFLAVEPGSGRPGWCMPTKIQFGLIFSLACRAGAPRDGSCGSPTRGRPGAVGG